MQTIVCIYSHARRSPESFRGVADRIACVTHGSFPRCSLGVCRENKSISASTMIRTSS